jgi:hypothetical protein
MAKPFDFYTEGVTMTKDNEQTIGEMIMGILKDPTLHLILIAIGLFFGIPMLTLETSSPPIRIEELKDVSKISPEMLRQYREIASRRP